jgi:hypothetical protein
MTSRTWFWKVGISLVALVCAIYEFYPIAPTPLEDFVPTQVIKQQSEFSKIHQEAKARVANQKNASLPADQKAISYYQASA